MTTPWQQALLTLWLGGMVVLGYGMVESQAQPQTILVSKKVSAAPPMQPVMGESWKEAAPLTFKAIGGKNLPGGSTEVTIRSVHTSDMVYFLIQYKDATLSARREPWQKQADGAWRKVKDPGDKGGDNNLYYEDKISIFWNINSPSFEQKGCMAACHTGEGKAYGNMYTPNPGELLDNWHWKSVRTGAVGQVDDQYVDSTRYDKNKTPEAGRKSDPKEGGGYADNLSEDKARPKYALAGNTPAPPYWLLESEKEAFDDSKYQAGSEVPGVIVAPFSGDRGDLSAQHAWKDGRWTLVIARKLVTNSEFDVQFNDLKKQYAFSVAIFDNAQVRHAYNTGVLKLAFE